MRQFLQKSLLISYTFIFIFTAQSAPQTPIEKNNPLIEFQTQFPSTSILLDDATGLPRMISNIQSESRGGPAVQIARAFLTQYGEFLMPGGSLSELKLIEVQQSENAEHVHFQQVYSGLPVYRAVVSVHIQDGRVVMYTGNYHPTQGFRDLSLQPSLGESQAEGVAIQRLGGADYVQLRGEIQMGRYIYPSGAGQYHLAYQVLLPAAVPLGDWELMIDAHTSEVLQQNDLLMYAEGAGQQNTNGSGSVYEENPITTRLPVDRVLPHLDDSGFLKGDFVNVLIYNGPTGVRADGRDFNRALVNNAQSKEHDFRYAPNDSRFDEANVYFHINRIHDYFKETFDFTGRDSSFPVIVGYPAFDERTGKVLNQPMNNAFFSPITQRLAIGKGTGVANRGLNNLARDADVLYHEYTHAVIDRITDLGQAPDDFGRAMGEAYGDYFSCSFFNDPEMGEWSVNNQRGMRNLNNNQRFPDNIYQPGTSAPEEHYTSLIWSGACWTLRGTIGLLVADQLIFNSLFFLPKDGSANFQIGLTALLQADESIFDGAHQQAIRQVFTDRGICDLAGCSLVSGVPKRGSISGVELLGLNQYTVQISSAQATLQVDLRAVTADPDIDLYVRLDRPVEVVQKRFAQPQIIADYRSEGEKGIESLTMTSESTPSLRAGLYYVAIVNWTDVKQIDYDLTATVSQAASKDMPPPKTVSEAQIILALTAATVEVRGQQQFNATVSGTENTTVIWQINGVTGGNDAVGTISPDGLYTAPKIVPETNVVTIEAIHAEDMNLRAKILVTIVPSAQIPVVTQALAIPEKSALLPNYPNPFNPETWMPYQLAEPAPVIISIYNAAGVLVRRLDLGHRTAGFYISRERAAYWDGRDSYGEVVANGAYFYHIEAGDFHATRKMVVVK